MITLSNTGTSYIISIDSIQHDFLE